MTQVCETENNKEKVDAFDSEHPAESTDVLDEKNGKPTESDTIKVRKKSDWQQNWNRIENMAMGNKSKKCPIEDKNDEGTFVVCNEEKGLDQIVCPSHYKSLGYRGRKRVATNILEFVPNNIRKSGVEYVKKTLNIPYEDGQTTEDYHIALKSHLAALKKSDLNGLADYLKEYEPENDEPDFRPYHINAIRKIVYMAKGSLDKILTDAAEKAAKAAEEAKRVTEKKKEKKLQNEEKMQYTIDCLKCDYPFPAYMNKKECHGKYVHPKHGEITDGMIDAGVDMLWKGDKKYKLSPRGKAWANQAIKVAEEAVEKKFPRDRDPNGHALAGNLNYFTFEVIERENITHLGKLLSTTMLNIACKNELRFRKKEQWKNKNQNVPDSQQKQAEQHQESNKEKSPPEDWQEKLKSLKLPA